MTFKDNGITQTCSVSGCCYESIEIKVDSIAFKSIGARFIDIGLMFHELRDSFPFPEAATGFHGNFSDVLLFSIQDAERERERKETFVFKPCVFVRFF